MSAGEALLERVREAIAPLVAREVPMFGMTALMVDDAMLVAVGRDGSLLARVSAEADEQLVHRPHARRAEMGAGRSMGVGWIAVEREGVAADTDLAIWLAACRQRRSH